MFYTLNYTFPKDHFMLATTKNYVAYDLIVQKILWALSASYDRSICNDSFWTTFHYDFKGFSGVLYLPDTAEPTEDFKMRVALDILSHYSDFEECGDANIGQLTCEPISPVDFCFKLARVDAVVQSFWDNYCCAYSDHHRRIHPSETPYEEIVDEEDKNRWC